MQFENDEIIIRPPTLEDEIQVLDYKKEFYDKGVKIYGHGSLQNFAKYSDWLVKLESYSNPETLPEGRVLSTQFITIRKSDGKMLGMVNVRHYLNDALLLHGGHIGDSIRPSEWGKGYGTAQISLALEFLKKIGVKRVLMTCNDDNPASRKTIVKNGGVLENSMISEGEIFERYWIEIQ